VRIAGLIQRHHAAAERQVERRRAYSDIFTVVVFFLVVVIDIVTVLVIIVGASGTAAALELGAVNRELNLLEIDGVSADGQHDIARGGERAQRLVGASRRRKRDGEGNGARRG
jgi:hypothetical protein